jgi:hypothetical protein
MTAKPRSRPGWQMASRSLSRVVALAALCALGYALLTPTTDPSGVLLARAISPNQDYEAELIEVNSGATDAYAYTVVLETPHRLLARKQIPFKSYMEPVPTSLRFQTNNTLEIILEGGRTLLVTIEENTSKAQQQFRFHRGVAQHE